MITWNFSPETRQVLNGIHPTILTPLKSNLIEGGRRENMMKEEIGERKNSSSEKLFVQSSKLFKPDRKNKREA